MSHVGSDTIQYVRGLSLQRGTCDAHTSGLQSNIRGPLHVPRTMFIRPHRGPWPYDAGQRKKDKGAGPFLPSQAHHMTHLGLGGSYMACGLDLPWQTNHALCE